MNCSALPAPTPSVGTLNTSGVKPGATCAPKPSTKTHGLSESTSSHGLPLLRSQTSTALLCNAPSMSGAENWSPRPFASFAASSPTFLTWLFLTGSSQTTKSGASGSRRSRNEQASPLRQKTCGRRSTTLPSASGTWRVSWPSASAQARLAASSGATSKTASSISESNAKTTGYQGQRTNTPSETFRSRKVWKPNYLRTPEPSTLQPQRKATRLAILMLDGLPTRSTQTLLLTTFAACLKQSLRVNSKPLCRSLTPSLVANQRPWEGYTGCRRSRRNGNGLTGTGKGCLPTARKSLRTKTGNQVRMSPQNALPLSYTREGFESGICRDLRSSVGLVGGECRFTAGRLRTVLRTQEKQESTNEHWTTQERNRKPK